MILVDFQQTAICTLTGILGKDKNIEVDDKMMRHIILNMLLDYKTRYGKRFGDLVITTDGNDYWRREIFPHYKFGRKKQRDESEYDWVQIKSSLNTVQKELAEFFPYPVIATPQAEADDIIAVMCDWSQENDLEHPFDEPKDLLIMSADTDMFQCHKFKNVKQVTPNGMEQIKSKVPLKQFILEHTLTGDAGDGIPNFLSTDDFFYQKSLTPDIKVRQKPVTATIKKHYMEVMEYDGLVREFRNEEEKKNYERNYQLVDFRCIPDTVRESIIASYQSQLGKDRSSVLSYLINNKIKNLVDRVEDF